MKRLTPPILDIYTAAQLASELDIPLWKIITACETGQIKSEYTPARTETKPRNTGPSFVRWASSRDGSGTKYSYPAYYSINKDEAQRFEAELFAAENNSKLPDTQPENAKATDSLLKLVAVMAVSIYRYDCNQNKSTVPGEIIKDAEGLGVNIDEKTVRKWLKQAVTAHIPTNNDNP